MKKTEFIFEGKRLKALQDKGFWRLEINHIFTFVEKNKSEKFHVKFRN